MQPQSLNSYPRGSVRALDPELQDRTTSVPQRSLIATPVSTVSNTGWRSAR
jgi:hypothetical protein